MKDRHIDLFLGTTVLLLLAGAGVVLFSLVQAALYFTHHLVWVN